MFMSTSMGQAYKDVLSPRQRIALYVGAEWLIEQGFDDMKIIGNPDFDIADAYLSDYLPARYLPKYTPLFLKQFFVTILIVAWKIAQPDTTYLTCVAEEMAAWAIIDEAEGYLEEHGEVEEADFGAFIDDVFEDTDFRQLFSGTYDGIEETELGKMLGMTSLAFKDWFVPFRGNNDPDCGAVHPYAQPDMTDGESVNGEDEDTADE